MGSCGTCLVRVESDLADLPPREELEGEMAECRGFAPRERLACQLPASDGLAVFVEAPDHSTKNGLL
jgi:ferredoxin